MQRIFVGDVQGCADELAELDRRARSEFSDDYELWIVGDLINRGPGSVRALELIREHVERGTGTYVLGNHEIALLSIAFGLREPSERDTFQDVLRLPDAAEWVDWLRRRPVAATGRLGSQDFAMVHASVHPDWDLEALRAAAARVESRLGADDEAEAVALLKAGVREDDDRGNLGRFVSCRSVGGVDGWSSSQPGGDTVAWHRQWAERDHDYGIVYGHWARQGLHVAAGLRGLDSGCVHHGRGRDGFLTGWLPCGKRSGEVAPFDVPDDRFWQVPARRRYYRY